MAAGLTRWLAAAIAAVAATGCATSNGEAMPPLPAPSTSEPSRPPATERQHASSTVTTSTTPADALPAGDDGVIARVVDGDTVHLADGTKVRLIGIDTPESVDPRRPVQCFGREASAYTASLVPPGEAVRLVYDVERLDRFGRTLAYLYRARDGLFVNDALVRNGYALASTYPPNVAHAGEFAALQREAREANQGLWAACAGEGEGEQAGPPPPALTPPPSTPPPQQQQFGDGRSGACDASYPDVCVPPAPPDLDCGDVAYRRFRVVGADPHRFDADRDGVGCESG